MILILTWMGFFYHFGKIIGTLYNVHVYIDICRINECNQNMLTFIKYTYSTTCFNYTYLLIFILSMITSKHNAPQEFCFVLYGFAICTAINLFIATTSRINHRYLAFLLEFSTKWILLLWFLLINTF